MVWKMGKYTKVICKLNKLDLMFNLLTQQLSVRENVALDKIRDWALPLSGDTPPEEKTETSVKSTRDTWHTKTREQFCEEVTIRLTFRRRTFFVD